MIRIKKKSNDDTELQNFLLKNITCYYIIFFFTNAISIKNFTRIKKIIKLKIRKFNYFLIKN